MQECFIYFPKDYGAGSYDIRFINALKSCGNEPTVIEDLNKNGNLVLKNKIVENYKLNLNDVEGLEQKTVYKYYCDNCKIVFSWKDLETSKNTEEYTLGVYENENKYLILPFFAKREIPNNWVRIEGRDKVFYMDAQTHHIFSKILKEGNKVSRDVIELSFPNSLGFPAVNMDRLSTMRIKYNGVTKKCPYCKGPVRKRHFVELGKGKIKVGMLSNNGTFYPDTYGKIILYGILESKRVIYIPEEIYWRDLPFSFNELEIRKYRKISSSKYLIQKLQKILRNMKNLSSKEGEYIDSIAISYVASLQKKMSEMIIRGDYEGALQEFFKSVKTFDLFFVQGARKYYGVPKVAIEELNDLFESLFNGEKLKLKINGNELPEEWRNFIDLYLNVEKLKAKMKGRRHQYSNIIISTISPLPPESDIKNIINVKEILIIRGIWHGIKFILKPNIEKIGKYYKSYASKISYMLSKKEAKDIIKKIEAGEYYIGVEGQSLRITREMVTIIPQLPEGYKKGKFSMGEFYLSEVYDKCQNFMDDIIRKINYNRHKLKLDYNDPIDVIVPDSECTEFIQSNFDYIIKRTNARKMISGDNFKIVPFYKSYIVKAISSYIDVDNNTAEWILKSGIENLYILQVGELTSLPIKDQEIKAKIKNARDKKINPVDEVDRVLCSLCGGNVENYICQKCGYHYD